MDYMKLYSHFVKMINSRNIYYYNKKIFTLYKYMKSLIGFHISFQKYKRSIYNTTTFSKLDLMGFVTLISSIIQDDYIIFNNNKSKLRIYKNDANSGNYYINLYNFDNKDLFMSINDRIIGISYTIKEDSRECRQLFNLQKEISMKQESNHNLNIIRENDIVLLLQDIFFYGIEGIFSYIDRGQIDDKSNENINTRRKFIFSKYKKPRNI